MNFEWNQLVEAMRAELQEYGAIRGTLDEQQNAIFNRDGETAGVLAGQLELQIDAAAKLRRQREEVTRDIARFQELPVHSTLAEMSHVFPGTVYPLVKALAEEINAMLNTLRRRSRQNQMLLARTCEIMEKSLQQLRPGTFVKTYSPKGSLALHLGPVGAHIQTAG